MNEKGKILFPHFTKENPMQPSKSGAHCSWQIALIFGFLLGTENTVFIAMGRFVSKLLLSKNNEK